jgi:hypothetical protein
MIFILYYKYLYFLSIIGQTWYTKTWHYFRIAFFWGIERVCQMYMLAELTSVLSGKIVKQTLRGRVGESTVFGFGRELVN